jgi:hypothetical protein
MVSALSLDALRIWPIYAVRPVTIEPSFCRNETGIRGEQVNVLHSQLGGMNNDLVPPATTPR